MLNDISTPTEPTPTPGIGHNSPPSDPHDVALARVAGFEASANKWAREVGEITDPDTAARANEILNQIADETKRIDALRVEEKRPHDEAAKAVQARWKPLLDALTLCKAPVDRLHRAWLKRESDRIAAEREALRKEAEQKRREAEAAAARAFAPTADPVSAQRRAEEAETAAMEAAKRLSAIPDRARSRGAISGRARSLQVRWQALIIDHLALYRHYADREEVKELMQRLANADARAGLRQLPGCKIFSEEV